MPPSAEGARRFHLSVAQKLRARIDALRGTRHGARVAVSAPPSTGTARVRPRERGQASVELVAVVPLILLVVLAAWQIALAGQTLWMCAHAARVAARAAAVGQDAAAAARSALPSALESGLRVSRPGPDAVRVEVLMPLVLRQWHAPLTVAASAGLPRGGS